MRIEKVEGNREGGTVSCLRQLYFGEEKKMRFRRGEVVLHRLKIRSKTANVGEVNVEKVKRGVKTFGLIIKRAVQPGWGHFWSPAQKGSPRLGLYFGVPIFYFEF
ncbi:hypothetical protein E2C01_053568 [Portunus trituberculatus]|uniref:Uncharacterized protein n=1 Tax=Portunus trituberculatus TaxID=210409 RepID=A0A5B7GPP8_PORTR|nr:hypothetical protein [Portunus trituberculatus]